MKLELLVIADQNAAVNAFPGLVHTARHTMGVGGARSRLANLLGSGRRRFNFEGSFLKISTLKIA